jgi:hypothetical protein
MATSTPEGHLSWYVIDYFGGLMTKAEWLAYRTFLAEAKDKAANSHSRDDMKTSDPEALALMADGVEAFHAARARSNSPRSS